MRIETSAFFIHCCVPVSGTVLSKHGRPQIRLFQVVRSCPLTIYPVKYWALTEVEGTEENEKNKQILPLLWSCHCEGETEHSLLAGGGAAEGIWRAGVGAGVSQEGVEGKEEREVGGSGHAGPVAPVRTVTLAGEAAAGCRAGVRSLNATKGRKWVPAGETATAQCVGREGSSKG